MYVLATYLALVLLATPLHATAWTFLLYAAFAAAVIGAIGTRKVADGTGSVKISHLTGAIALFAAMRIIPFMRWGSSALGADMGAYYRNFNACFASFTECIKEPVAATGYLPYVMGFGTQAILIALHLAASAAIAIGAYRITKSEWGEKAAFWSIAIYAISLPQFLFYWSFFLKMELAVAASLFSVHAYAQKQKRAGIYAALAGSIHPLTVVPLAVAFVAAGIANNTKKYSFGIAAMGVIAIMITKWSAIFGYVGYALSYARGTYAFTEQSFLAGHFIGFSFYHNSLMLFYVPFALLAVAWLICHEKLPAIGWYALINLVLISINAVFHNRFIVLFDISCIILAGYTVAVFAERFKTPPLKKAFALLMVLIAGYSLYESARMEPLVNAAELKELMALQGKYGGMPIFINNATYRQLVSGYTKHPAILSPFNEEPWRSLGIPSLIYNARRSTPINPASDPHFTRVSERIFKYTP